jgi:UDP-glucose:(heptosyl)LPS alpha-1,3-glucosyltransferase
VADTAFIYVGSGFARKGLGTAIDALARTARPDFRLLVAGRDRDLERFRHQARRAGVGERVDFLGGRDDMRAPYAAADCLVLPSLYDPFGIAVLEALAMGLPAIVSSRCGAAEIIESGVNGWVCEPGDSAAIAQLMQTAERAARGGVMAAAARATAERFGIEAMAEKFVRLYQSLAYGAAG